MNVIKNLLKDPFQGVVVAEMPKSSLSAEEKRRLADENEEKKKAKRPKFKMSGEEKVKQANEKERSGSARSLVQQKSKLCSECLNDLGSLAIVWEIRVCASPTSDTLESCLRPFFSVDDHLKTFVIKARTFLHDNEKAQRVVSGRGLSELQALCIISYTFEDSDFDIRENLSIYPKYNKSFSVEDNQDLQKYALFTHYFKAGIVRLPRVGSSSEAKKVYRGITGKVNSAEYINGSQVKWRGFTSTTRDAGVMRAFGKTGRFIVEAREGYLVGDLSFHADEQEVLLPPNSIFQVKSMVDSSEVADLVGETFVMAVLTQTEPLPNLQSSTAAPAAPAAAAAAAAASTTTAALVAAGSPANASAAAPAAGRG